MPMIIKMIIEILRGEEFVPRAEGSVVNDDTKVFVDFIGSVKTEGLAKEFYNHKTGKIEIIYVLSSEKE